MSENLLHLFQQSFSTNLQLRLQQMSSLLRDHVMSGNHNGARAASVVQYETPFAMQAPAGRFAPLNRTDVDFQRRWIMPIEKEAVQYIDSFDQAQTLIDPQSSYVMNAAAAVGRAWDDQIIASALGTAYKGVGTSEAGALTTESFAQAATDSPAGVNSVAVDFGNGSTAIGVTLAKLIESRRLLRKNHVDINAEPLCLVIGSQQEADLLSLTQVTSAEWNGSRPTLVDGRVTHFMGFDIIVSERLSFATTNVRSALVFPKSGLYLGQWIDLQTKVSIADWLSSQPIMVYTRCMFGATRLEPGKVIEIKCADTTGTDNV